MAPGTDPAVLRALAELLPGRCSTRTADLDAASRDASSLPGARPEAVVWPLSTDEVATVVHLAHQHRVPLTPRGAGSSLEGNPIPVRGGIVLDCSRMTTVISVRPADLQMDAQPGVVYAATPARCGERRAPCGSSSASSTCRSSPRCASIPRPVGWSARGCRAR
ncbi:MAG: FAD-binding oxidoreductase [Deltaproteobacteria bacterium]|nr:MAG: FAD-binding oxidoreductase [Deltaproteobacteria bacterium]